MVIVELKEACARNGMSCRSGCITRSEIGDRASRAMDWVVTPALRLHASNADALA